MATEFPHSRQRASKARERARGNQALWAAPSSRLRRTPCAAGVRHLGAARGNGRRRPAAGAKPPPGIQDIDDLREPKLGDDRLIERRRLGWSVHAGAERAVSVRMSSRWASGKARKTSGCDDWRRGWPASRPKPGRRRSGSSARCGTAGATRRSAAGPAAGAFSTRAGWYRTRLVRAPAVSAPGRRARRSSAGSDSPYRRNSWFVPHDRRTAIGPAPYCSRVGAASRGR